MPFQTISSPLQPALFQQATIPHAVRPTCPSGQENAPWGSNSPDCYKAPAYDDAMLAKIDAAPDRFPTAGRPSIRSTRKAESWAGALYRAYGYVSARIHPGERAEMAALLEQTIQAGPDFLRVRANATFAPVPIVAYSREAAAEIVRQAREIERESYASRDKGKHGGALGRMALQLLEWFAFVLWPKSGRFGMVPSLAHIAIGSRMSRASVVEAMKRLEAFGFMSIERRRQRVPTLFGVKVVQATNGYVLGVAKGLGMLALAAFGNKPRPPCGNGRPSESSKSPAIRVEHYPSGRPVDNCNRKPDFTPMRA